MDESAQGILRAAALADQAKPEDMYLPLAERYFAGEYLLRAKNFAAFSSRSQEKAVSFLTKHYSQLALDNDALDAKQKKIFPRLCCGKERMMTTIKAHYTR